MSKDAKSSLNKPLSFKEKLCFGLGDISHGLAISSIGVWMLKYLTDVAMLRPGYASLALLLGRVWDAVTDPLMGWITDHTETRFGKRRPYLLFGAIPYALAFFALWTIPVLGGDQVLIFAYVVIASLVFNTCLTMVFVPYTTLTAAMTDSYDERTTLTGYRMAASQTAFLIGASIPTSLVIFVQSDGGQEFLSSFGLNELFGSWAGTARQGFFLMAIMFGFIMVASILTAFFGTRERIRKSVLAPGTVQATPLNYANSILQELQNNKPFQISAAILLITNCASTLVLVNLPFFLEYVVGLRTLQPLIFFLLFLSSILSMPFWVYFAKRFGKTETYRGAMLMYVFVLCGLAFLQPGQSTLALIIAMFAGFFSAAGLMIPWAIIPDVVEYDELKTNKRREGLFYGGTTFCYKAATGIAVFLSGISLEMAGYQANQTQTEEVGVALRMLIGPAPALLIILAALLSRRYPLTAERHKKIVTELEMRRQKEQAGEKL